MTLLPRRRRYDLVLKLLDKRLIRILFHRVKNILFLNANMANSDHDIATKALDAHESTFFELVVESQDASASCVKVPRVLK